jgi:actin-related protein
MAGIEEDKFLVFDIGSSRTKIGYAGEDNPRYQFETVCYEPQRADTSNLDTAVWTVGEFLAPKPTPLVARYRTRSPIQWGTITDWDAWEELMSYNYLKMGEDPSKQPVFLTEPQKNPKDAREKTVYYMFETFDVPAFFMASQAVLALYAANSEGGTIIHIGDGTADIIPYIYGEAKFLNHAASSFAVAGRDVSEYLAMLLGKERNEDFFSREQRKILRNAKESECYVSKNFEQEFARASYASKKLTETSFQLPNGKFITLGSEKFLAPEIFFKPHLDSPGIHEMLVDVIKKCDISTRYELYDNIVLAGGATMTKGFAERLEIELKKLVPSAPVHIHVLPNAHLLPWQGASFVAQIPAFNEQNWITRREYDEHGESIVHKKCTMN